MKIIFGILASKNDNYSKFIDIWINNIKRFKSTPLKDTIDFYFLYTEKDSQCGVSSVDEDLYYNYYSEFKEDECLMDTFVNRTIGVLDYLKTTNKIGDFFIRTNLSTLFQLDILINWAESLPLENMIAGSVIDNINSIHTHLSGTNIVLTRDLIHYILVNKEHVLKNSILNGDDARISSLVIENLCVNLLLIKRLDFIKIESKGDEYEYLPPLIVFQSTNTTENLFCYRFKTKNRDLDIKIMNLLMNKFYDKNFNILEFISVIITDKETPFSKAVKQNDKYDKLTSNLFTLTTNHDIMKCYNRYIGKNIQCVYDLQKRDYIS